MTEKLRRRLCAWYRGGQPWARQPTLDDFRRSGRLPGDEERVLSDLIARLGGSFQLQDLRLLHLLESSLSLSQDTARPNSSSDGAA
jgi:hypothetical protein